jgi:hypothetical protein
MAYPGISTEAKTYLWKSVSAATLLYGMDSIFLSKENVKHLQSAQGSIIKKVMGFRKCSHHTNLQKALNIILVDDSIHKISAGLLNHIFQVETPASHVQAILLSNFFQQA